MSKKNQDQGLLFGPSEPEKPAELPRHTCHHPTCKKETPPRMLACPDHWLMLPKQLRDNIWDTYRPGQEIDKKPSKEYLEAADACKKWWLKNTLEGSRAAPSSATTRCRSCSRPIVWKVRDGGRRCPFDPDGTNHFITCPHGKDWRKKQ